MEIGKLSNELLKELVLDKIQNTNKYVKTGAGIGEDCCFVDMGSGGFVMSGDPITAAGRGAGMLAVHVTANDIAAAGGKPCCAMVTLLIPPESDMTEVETVVDELTGECMKLNIEIGGGHTEVTPSVNQIVINMTMLGKLIGENMVSSAGAKVGDSIVMSKAAAIEGTLILFDDYCSDKNIPLNNFDIMQLECMRDCLSVVKEGAAGVKSKVHAMHDITEGGVLGAIIEMSKSAGLGAEVCFEKIPVFPITEKLCSYFSIDPYKFVSSGSMLFATDDPESLIAELAENNVDAFIIGKMTESGFICSETKEAFSENIRDELYKLQGSVL